MASIGEALLIAFDHHRSGRLAEADTLYRRILQADPEQPDALHLLGVLAGQAGRPGDAHRFIARAIALSPGNPDYPSNLANMLRVNGLTGEARLPYARAVALQPANGEAAARLAAIEARLGLAQALERLPAVLAGGVGAEALYEFALAALDAGWPAEAEWLLERAAALAPDSAVSHANLALLLHRRGETARAVRHYAAAVALRPAFAEMLVGLAGLAFDRRGGDPRALAEAAALFLRAARLAPLDRDAAIRLTVALIGLGRETDVPAVLAPHLVADPTDLLVLFNLAQAGQNRDDGGESLACYRRILTLDPALADAVQGLGRLLVGFGFACDGMRWQERALALLPTRVDWLRQLLMTVLYVPNLDPERRFALHRRLDELSSPAAPAVHADPYGSDSDPGRRLRVGYLTTDLRALQPVARNMLPLYREHDHGRFSIHTYADIAEPDATTRRFRELSDGWCDVRGLDDAAVADRIRADGIDVLVLLAARFDRNRPLVCQHRPAPVQISFHDAGTSGLSTVDGILTDRTMTPRRTTERFTERPLRLPSFYIADIPADAPPVGPLPMLRDGIVRFGCFNNPAKISDETLRLWAWTMNRVPQSRLVLKYTQRYRNPLVLGRIRDILGAVGIGSERIEATWDRVDTVADHLAGYNRIDIALDPFPFTGSTTTFEALSMGVPVVTLAQEPMVSRWSASMLQAVGLPHLAAVDEQQYVDAVTGLVRDPVVLSQLRAALRGRLAASPLCDGRRRTRQVERLYRGLWRRWCLQGLSRPA